MKGLSISFCLSPSCFQPSVLPMLPRAGAFVMWLSLLWAVVCRFCRGTLIFLWWLHVPSPDREEYRGKRKISRVKGRGGGTSPAPNWFPALHPEVHKYPASEETNVWLVCKEFSIFPFHALISPHFPPYLCKALWCMIWIVCASLQANVKLSWARGAKEDVAPHEVLQCEWAQGRKQMEGKGAWSLL